MDYSRIGEKKKMIENSEMAGRMGETNSYLRVHPNRRANKHTMHYFIRF